MALSVLLFAENFTILEISDIRTNSYEFFIASFYFWSAIIAILFTASLIFSDLYRRAIYAAFIATVFVGVIFVFEGRGSNEHIMPFIGNFLNDFSWESLLIGKVPHFIAGFFAVGFSYVLLSNIAHWIKNGRFNGKIMKNSSAVVLSFSVIILAPVLTLPFGIYLNSKDVEETKGFIAKLIPDVVEYYVKNEKYPQQIFEVTLGDIKTPRLINVYEYLANKTKGSYYLSRPQKFCFIFMDPGKDFGYYSITSDSLGFPNPWKFFPAKSTSLEYSFLEVCDESKATHEGILAERLGIASPDDPIAKMGVEIDRVLRPASTSIVSKELEDRIHEIGKDDPSIYYGGKDPNKKHEITNTEELKKAITDAEVKKKK